MAGKYVQKDIKNACMFISSTIGHINGKYKANKRKGHNKKGLFLFLLPVIHKFGMKQFLSSKTEHERKVSSLFVRYLVNLKN